MVNSILPPVLVRTLLNPLACLRAQVGEERAGLCIMDTLAAPAAHAPMVSEHPAVPGGLILAASYMWGRLLPIAQLGIEAQKDEVSCPRAHSSMAAGRGLTHSPWSKPSAFIMAAPGMREACEATMSTPPLG